MFSQKHQILNVPNDDSIESSIARGTEETLDMLGRTCQQAEDQNASEALSYFGGLYDHALEQATEKLEYDINVIASFGGDQGVTPVD